MACQWRASGLHIVIQWRAVASFEFLKTRMKLNLRSLYMADGNATAELLQVSTLLQQAIASASSEKLPETTLFKRVKAARSLVLDQGWSNGIRRFGHRMHLQENDFDKH
ncbi:uncharacterized protein LOC112343893 isoform X3 [Selaginella moellendorffii]|uniref:uncharacterized protein LOC112343893 isoform X3 n=1 Tax=Selaginella moellendorffii TaxID=88036 RepID=UPI000D1C8DFC|nr:uncharacterized protein LOC112343893 isoform X3 [Selaginella moellendorffii]|eukprot:XP_024523750.1 uncharacterized protein LOC112343893 isoform X3 [Selaginella moellendorffii]